MNTLALIQHTENLLKTKEKYTDKNKQLFIPKILEDIEQIDLDLVQLLVSDTTTKKHFFTTTDDFCILNQNKLIEFFTMNEYFNHSFTAYKNKIGLIKKDSFIKKFDDVVLAFPYKDCLLEGGQTKDDEKNSEVFYNSVISADEIDRLLEPKVLTNIKKFDKDGEHKVDVISEDDNLIIKGNNLLALHSLKERYRGKVKLIYIDPPYNTGNDSFNYNDNFNHSTWLTFMKNRLEVAKEFLSDDGVIFVHIDNNELAYLKVLMDELFPYYQSMITLEVKSPSGDSSKSKSMLEDTCEYILCFSKSKYINHSKPQQIKEIIDENSKTVSQYKTLIKGYGKATDEYFEFEIGAGKDKEVMKAYKVQDFDSETIPSKDRTQEYYKDNISQIGRTAAFSGAFKKAFQNKKDNVYMFDYITTRGKNKGIKQVVYVVNGEQLIYLKDYSKEVMINKKNKLVKMEKTTNFINDISWQGIASEGGIILKNGKKPEELLKRLIQWTTTKNDLVMDFHLGSATTCAVAHKMGRRYIGIEQMDYIEDISVERMKKVIEGEQGGISKSVDWQGGGSFIYCELKEIENFKDCEIGRLNKNMQYLPIGDIDDTTYKMSDEEISINKKFYNV